MNDVLKHQCIYRTSIYSLQPTTSCCTVSHGKQRTITSLQTQLKTLAHVQ